MAKKQSSIRIIGDSGFYFGLCDLEFSIRGFITVQHKGSWLTVIQGDKTFLVGFSDKHIILTPYKNNRAWICQRFNLPHEMATNIPKSQK